MHDWMIILLIALASFVIGFWALRRCSTEPAALPETSPTAPGKGSGSPGDVTNTTVAPLPENRHVALLEFDGPPGQVPVKCGELVIGRHSSDDVRIPDVRVSRQHARLVARSDGRFEIHNLTTVRSVPNPMLVNGADRDYADIVNGDVISLGGVSFQLRLAAA